MPRPGACCIAGVLEALLVGGDAWRNGAPAGIPLAEVRRGGEDVLQALRPGDLGSADTQIALFADTIIASFLAAGALSALYYADRLNQLPIGVIGIAVGTVLLPEMANRIAGGDERGARHAQNRAIELTLLLSIPVLRRVPAGSRSDHARAVRARRVYRGRRAAPRPRRSPPTRSGCSRSC